jgi:Meiotically up-regulated gene 113
MSESTELLTVSEACVDSRIPTQTGTLVYFARCQSLIKIGFTKDLANRVRDMQCGNPNEIVVIATIRDTHRKAETHFHKTFARYRKSKEWFDFDAEGFETLKREIRSFGGSIKNQYFRTSRGSK